MVRIQAIWSQLLISGTFLRAAVFSVRGVWVWVTRVPDAVDDRINARAFLLLKTMILLLKTMILLLQKMNVFDFKPWILHAGAFHDSQLMLSCLRTFCHFLA